MAVEGNDPGALRHVATGLRATATTLAAVSATYMSIATAKSLAASKGAYCVAKLDEDLLKKAKEIGQYATTLFQLADAADAKAVKQTTASAASGFVPPAMTFPDVPQPGPIPTGGARGGGSPLDLSGGLGQGGASTGLGGLVDPGTPSLQRSVFDGADLGLVDQTGPDATIGADADETGADGPLALARRLGVGAGVAAAGAVGAGIAASILIANRRRAQRDTEQREDEESDADVVEAVYQTGSGQRTAAG